MADESVAPADQPRVLATIGDYLGLMAALRARAQEKHAAINGHAAAAGLDRCIARLISADPIKRVDMGVLGKLLALLNCKLVMVEDLEAVRKYTSRLPLRNEAFVHSNVITITLSRRFMGEIGRKGQLLRWKRVRAMHALASKAAHIRWDNTTRKQRGAYARKAARARWANGGKANGVSVKP